MLCDPRLQGAADGDPGTHTVKVKRRSLVSFCFALIHTSEVELNAVVRQEFWYIRSPGTHGMGQQSRQDAASRPAGSHGQQDHG